MTGAVRAAWRVLLVASCCGSIAPGIAAADDPTTVSGGRLYEKYCATRLAEQFRHCLDLRRLKADELPRFVNALQHGKNAMPSWQGVLRQKQIEALWLYIRAHAYQP